MALLRRRTTLYNVGTLITPASRSRTPFPPSNLPRSHVHSPTIAPSALLVGCTCRGITDTRKLTVKTTIYVSTIDDSQLEAQRDDQMARARVQISEQLKDFQSMYLALQKVVHGAACRVQSVHLALQKVHLARKCSLL